MDSKDSFNRLLSHIDEIGKKYIMPYSKDVDQKARFPDEAFLALKERKLLGVYIPKDLGGEGLSVAEVAKLCEKISPYCASTALIYAMHQSQIACLVHHAFGAPALINALQMMAAKQSLVASSTSEVHIGGDLRSSICALTASEKGFTIEKHASVLSYGEKSDAILITCKKSINATARDQVLVLGYRKDCTLTKTSEWDTLGLRGTCSAGFNIKASGPMNHVFPTPFSKILNDTMQPVAHIYWSSVWLGMASSAVNIAQKTVVDNVKKQKNSADIQTLRFAELNTKLSSMRSNLTQVIKDYEEVRSDPDMTDTERMNFATKVNNLKINSSKYLIQIVSDAMMLIGISSYSVISKNSLCQLLRDAFGAPLMVSNDRLLNHNSTLHLVNT